MSERLPKDDTAWPPPQVAGHYNRMRQPDAWYSGDPARLMASYGVKTREVVNTRARTTLNPGGGIARYQGNNAQSFWATSGTPGESDTRRHLPVAQDIATMSADLLFSEPPAFRVMGPVGADGTDDEGEPTLETRAAQQRLDRILKKCNAVSLLLAAAETQSPLGSVGLRIAVNKTAIPDRPVLTRVDADAVIPYYSWGQLVAVAFWHVVEADTDRNVYWRFIELHEAGRTWPALYKGDAERIGKRQPLTAHQFTSELSKSVGPDGSVILDAAGGRTATSIPNMLPDPQDRQNQAGRSDYTLPVMDLFDGIDKTYSQFMDELDDARSRLFIADSLLSSNGPGQGVSFDAEQRLYRRVNMPPAEEESGKLPIEKVQFDIRVEEYLATIEALTYKAISAAGFNPEQQRDAEAAEMTATEVSTRNRRSMTTRDKKIRYWQGELEELLTTLVRIDVAQFAPYEQVDGRSVRVLPYPVEVQFPEAVQPTQMELANTAKALKEAGESVLEIQRVLHPDWSERKLREAAKAVENAASIIDPVSFGSGGQGVGVGDGL